MRRPSVAIVGLGLIGGSLARSLTRAGYRVIGVDRPAVLRRARRAGAIATSLRRLEDAAARADILVLAAPPATNLRLLRPLARLGRKGLVISDVSSVKGPICREARRLGVRGFVGGHPMAGSERSGFAASEAGLFRGRPWILTPDGAAPSARRAASALVRACGARPVTLTPLAHDRAVAFLSHLPQLVAWAVRDAARLDPVARRHLGLAGPGFRDVTRLARSPESLWREILAQNRLEVRRAVSLLGRLLGRRSRAGRRRLSRSRKSPRIRSS